MAGNNRNKKTYSYNRSQSPKKVNGVDITNETVDNSYFVIDVAQEQGTPPSPPILPAEYDENVIDFTWEESKSTSFTFTFSATPIVTLEVLP